LLSGAGHDKRHPCRSTLTFLPSPQKPRADLNISREGDSTTSLGNLLQCSVTLRVTEPWPRLLREAVESPSLEILKTRLDKALCSLLWVTLLRQWGWTR